MTIFSIIVDEYGNIINNINSFPFFKLAFLNLNIPPNKKILLTNISENNYIAYRIPLKIKDYSVDHYILEPWRMNNNIQLHNNQEVSNDDLYNISQFSDFEQELIFSLLSGYISDKEIESFIKTISKTNLKGNIKYSLSNLFMLFKVSTRTQLIKLLQRYNFDKYIPKTLFFKTQYEIN